MQGTEDRDDEVVEVAHPGGFNESYGLASTTTEGEPPWEESPDVAVEGHVVLENVLANMAQAVLEERTQVHTPPVVTLCGSTRFRDHFEAAERAFTRKGIIVLTVGGFWSREEGSLEAAIGEEDARRVYGLHMDKISMADAVVLLDVGGYMGDTTRTENVFARQIGIPVLSYNEWTTRAPLSQAPTVVSCQHVWHKNHARATYECVRADGCKGYVTEDQIITSTIRPDPLARDRGAEEHRILGLLWEHYGKQVRE